MAQDEPSTAVKLSNGAPVAYACIPALLLPGSLASSDYRWIMESFVGVGDVCIGLPGLISMGIFLNPLFEAMPRIRQEGCVGKLPLLPYSAMATQGMVWTFYGALAGNPAIWTPNFAAMLLGLYYTSVYLQYCPKNADWLPFTSNYHAVVFCVTALLCCGCYFVLPPDWAMNVLGLIGNVMTMTMFGGPLAAMRTVIREKSTRAMTLGFTLVVNLNCNFWAFYAYFMLNDPYIYIQDGLGLLLTTVQLALFARYGIHRSR